MIILDKPHLYYVCRRESGHEEFGAGVTHSRQLEVGRGHHQVLYIRRRDGHFTTDVGGHNQRWRSEWTKKAET